NGSFESADAWSSNQQGIDRDASAVHSGSTSLTLHGSPTTAPAIWQDVKAEPGHRYCFSIYAQQPADGAGQLQLRMESTLANGPVTVNAHAFDVSKLASGHDWTQLTLNGTAPADNLRVL